MKNKEIKIDDLIKDFKVAMQKGKRYVISTLSDSSEFTCYMNEGSSTLKIETITGNIRYTTFQNIERYFKDEPIKDEKHYVIAICEWLENTNLKEDVTFNYDEIKNTLKLFTNNFESYLKRGEKGYFYNIFMESNIAAQEIRHSKYLANLFNKNSNHFHGNLFFKKFIEELKHYEDLSTYSALTDFNVDNYSIVTEEYDKENDEQKGFMDIVIRDNKYMIIIENKTGTKDHSGQLIRYQNYAQVKKDKKEIDDYIILYLTPEGDEPTDHVARDSEKIVSISYISNIRNSMINSKEFIKNDVLSNIVQQYIDSIPLYVYNLPINWEYELDTLYTITESISTFKNCSNIVNIVNNNLMYDNQIFTKEEISIAKWISKYFIKSKALIERNFLSNLSDALDSKLEEFGFIFSRYSNILVDDFPDNSKIDEVYDLNTIYKARLIRQRGVIQNQSEEFYEELREKTKSLLVYEKYISEDESIFLQIQNDISGLHASIYNYKDGIHELLTYKYVLKNDEDLFSSQNIRMFLDKKYSLKMIKESTKNIVELMLERF